MAASYATPPSVHAHSYEDGYHIQDQESMNQRFPLDSALTNGEPLDLRGRANASSLKPHQYPQAHTQIYPQQLHSNQHTVDEDCQDVTSQLSSPNFQTINLNGSRPKSMQRRISVGLPTHLRLQGRGYGIPAGRKRTFASSGELKSSRWITIPEIVSSVFLPLPYVLVSMIFDSTKRQISIASSALPFSEPSDRMDKEMKPSKVAWMYASKLPSILALSAGVLAIVGIIGKIRGDAFIARDRRKVSSNDDEKITPPSGRSLLLLFRRLSSVILQIALPLLATYFLGSIRVGLVLLIALTTKIMSTEDEITGLTTVKGWRQLLIHRRWTLISLLIQTTYDYVVLVDQVGSDGIMIGYLILGLSVFVLPPPLPSVNKFVTTNVPSRKSSTSASIVLSSGFETAATPEAGSFKKSTITPLLHTHEDISITFKAATLAAVLSCLGFLLQWPDNSVFSVIDLLWGVLTACAAVASIILVEPKSLQENKGLGFIIGALVSNILSVLLNQDFWRSFAYQGVLIAISFLATQLDTPTVLIRSSHPKHSHSNHHHVHPHTVNPDQYSRFTQYLIRRFQHWPLLHSILVEKDSRRILYFMCLNFSFMLIQTFYGIATGSLGLLSDSIHMFFDCLALIVGLCASVMSKWPPSTRFPYGYSKVDTLAGFANGIFLMLISIEIVYEAVERLAEGSEMQRIGELLTVSTLGLIVNVIGVTAFGHAHHGHSHAGHDHSHPHEAHDRCEHSQKSHDHSELDHKFDRLHATPNASPYSSVPATPSKPVHPHSHTNSHAHHHHHHSNENMYGIYLHILADTLGSVAVVVSTLAVHYFGWSGFDPLASCVIAILIFASAIPLVHSSATTLLLTIPEETEFDLREALAGVSKLRGVTGYAAPKFWLEGGEERRVLGVIHVHATKVADLEDVKERTVAFLKGKNMDVTVQVERDSESRCWCRTGS
ncbi:MAG: hypothetical protein Q9167_001490 [Letrouitia subvulpina]